MKDIAVNYRPIGKETCLPRVNCQAVSGLNDGRSCGPGPGLVRELLMEGRGLAGDPGWSCPEQGVSRCSRQYAPTPDAIPGAQ